MKMVAKQIKTKDGVMTILWNDGHLSEYNCRDVRMACRCAGCIEEWTQRNLVSAQQIPPFIKPLKIDPVGNYALSFQWSDGHSTGLYTYDYLREICACATCRAPREFAV